MLGVMEKGQKEEEKEMSQNKIGNKEKVCDKR